MSDAAPATARRLGRPPDVDSNATRSRLVTVARQHFARDGFDATTNRAIAEAAGITTGAIYHYFASKAEMYEAVYLETLDHVYAEFEGAVAGPTTLLEQFSALLDAAVRLNDEDPSLSGFVVGIASETQRHPDLAERLRPFRGRNTRFLRGLVESAADRGELAGDVEPRAVEDLLAAVLAGLARFSAVTGDGRRHADAVAALKRFFAGTLVGR
jgi:AcrR family transcriptional regulator